MISILLLLLGAILPWCSHGEHHLIYKGEGKVGVTSEIKHHSLDGYELVKTHLSTNPDITIGVNSTVLSYSGEWFTVTWSGVADPQYTDWIALYIAPGGDIRDGVPLKIKYASQDPEYMQTGGGTLNFTIVNYKQDVRFALVRGGPKAMKAVAQGPPIIVANPNQALQGHLALTNKPGEMTVQWSSWNATMPTVKWGTKSGVYTANVSATTHTFTREDLCGGLARGAGWVEPGVMHKATLTGLTPGRRYVYVYGDPAWGWSSERSFINPPAPGSGNHAPLSTTPAALAAYAAEEAERKLRSSHDGGCNGAHIPGMPGVCTQPEVVAAMEAVGLVTSPLSSQADMEGATTSSSPSSEADMEGGRMGEGGHGHRHGRYGGHSAHHSHGRHQNEHHQNEHHHHRSHRGGRKLFAAASRRQGDLPSEIRAWGGYHDSDESEPQQVFEVKDVDEGVSIHDDDGNLDGRGDKGDKGGVVRVLVSGDFGQAEEDLAVDVTETNLGSLATVRNLVKELGSHSLLVSVGDLAYGRGYPAVWEVFMNQFEPVASRVPFMVVPGNQERGWPNTGDRFNATPDSGGECGVVYENRFVMPQPGRDQMWYSFDYGHVHFVMYSTEHKSDPQSPQGAFIAEDLAKINRRLTPWVVFVGHRPWYVSSTHNIPPDGDQDVAATLREDLEDLILKHKVDLLVHGHHHDYQRSCPIVKGECVGFDMRGVARGPVYVITGNGGAGLTLEFQYPTPTFIQATYVWWGYSRMEASSKVLVFESVSNMDGRVVDRFVLRK